MTERPPWMASDLFDDSVRAYYAARNVGDESEKEWSFVRLAHRLRVQEPNGLDFSYEPLSTWEEVCSALILSESLERSGVEPSLGYSLTAGFDVFDSIYRSMSGHLSVPTPDEPFRGRHSVRLIDFDQSMDRIVFANSWGRRWGDSGFGYMPQEYFERFVDDVALARPAWIGPSPTMSAKIRELAWRRGTPGSDDHSLWLQAWNEAPIRIKGKVVRLGGQEHTVQRRMLYTFRGLPFDVAQIRRGHELRGRIHLVHDRSTDTSVAWEFWVPKASRRRGYGTALNDVALELMGYVGTKHLRVPLHEVDSTAEGIARARRFALASGYRWHESRTTRPVTLGCAEMQVL